MAKLLIVDDEPHICEFAANFFRKRGMEVFVASEGGQALDMIAQKKPDLVLLDMEMPLGMDGIQVLRELRKRNLTAKVIMVSAYLTDDYIKVTKALGAIDFVHKPLLLSELEKVVFSYLNKE